MTENPSIRLDDSLDDESAIDTLSRFYRDQMDTHLSALARHELTPHGFRASYTQTAQTLIDSVCDRIRRESSFADITVSIIGLRQFAQNLLDPSSPWPVIAIYEEAPQNGRSISKAGHQQTAERMLDRIGTWLERITGQTAVLCWPLVCESIPLFTTRINHARSWLDALPWHATALHAPILTSARLVAGDSSLASRFIEESHNSVISPFRTQVDLEYLASYLSTAIEALQRTGQRPTSESQEVWQADSNEAIDALLSIEEIKRLAKARPSPQLDKSLQTNWGFWLEPTQPQNSDRHRHTDSLCQAATEWFESSFGTPLHHSPLSDWILVGKQTLPTEHRQLISQRFESPDEAWCMLHELANEQISALSSRNCRYHFSRIVTPLLQQIAQTPSPDLTLRNMVHTGSSLGGKGVLWELLSSHQLLMELYTRLCGASPYLVQILLSNPGMIDDLLDSLMLERIPDYSGFETALESLCKGTSDIEGVVLSFKNAMHLAIGMRDILGRESITEIHRALAEVHEVCLKKLVEQAYRLVATKYPEPRKPDSSLVEYAVLAVGKLASREPNYHSDIPMLLLYDSPNTSHGMFFQQVAQKLIQLANRVTRFGRLFELKAWAFQTLKSSGLAWTTEQLIESIASHEVPAAEMMSLYTARLIGNGAFPQEAELQIERFLHSREWTKQNTFELIEWRRGLEQTATEDNIKRGSGGTLDVEVLTHIFYAKHLHTPKHPWLRGTIERLESLRKNGVISPQVALQLRDAYYFLRGVESGLRLMNTKLRHDLPRDLQELSKLAYVLQSPDPEQLLESCNHYRHAVEEQAQRHYAQFRAQVVGLG